MNDKAIHRVTVLMMLFGVALSLIQFLYNRSLWLDEAMLSLNIIGRSHRELLNPLEYMQVAPIGFLQIEKIFSELVPDSEYGLRLFPLLCFWTSIYLFYKIANILVKDSKSVLLAVTLFCLNGSLLYYSSEVKQYMIDVFVGLLLYYLFLKEYKNDRNRHLLLALFGVAGIFLSNISIIILSTVSFVLIIDQIKKRKKIETSLFFAFVVWAMTFCFYYFKFIDHHPNRSGMLAYWGNSFMPFNIFDISFWDFCFYKTKMIFDSLLSFGIFGLVPFLFFIIGLYKLIKDKKKKLLWLLLSPTLLQLALSLFKFYPFDLRLILYQSGFLILVISVGVMYVFNLNILKAKKYSYVLILSAFFLILLFGLLKSYPIKVEELKKSLCYVSDHIEPDETVYVYYGSIPAFTYYSKTSKINFKNKIVFGHAYRGNNAQYVEEIKNNKGKCWLIFSHIYDNESRYISTSLDSSFIREFDYRSDDSEAYLYNLSK